MSLENAILRRTKFGQSFCSYTFRKVPKTKGFTLISVGRAGRDSMRKNAKASSRVTTDTNSCSTENIKQTQQLKQTNETEWKLKGKVATEISFHQNKENVQLNQQPCHLKNKPNEINEMEQYLSELYQLREPSKFKFNKFEHIPLNLEKIFNLNCQQKHWQGGLNRYKKNSTKFSKQSIVKKPFESKSHKFLFQDFSLQENNPSIPFTKLRIIGIEKKMCIECAIGKKLFSEIPIKSYCNDLNNYSTSLESNIFYICLSKQENILSALPYTQCFFWLSRPFKHSERPQALKSIIKFLAKCLDSLSVEECSPKIWIVDFNGKISYVNREQVYRLIDQYENDLKSNSFDQGSSKQIFLSSKITGNACLNMFLSTMSKGIFVSKGKISSGVTSPQLDQQF